MRHFLFLYLLTVAFSCIVNGQNISVVSSKAEYEKWIAPYKINSAAHRYSINNSSNEVRPKLVIAVVTEKKPSADNKLSFIGDGKFSHGAVIFADGKVNYFSHGPFGSKGSCCSKVEENELEQIDRLLRKLPSDKSFLPPENRRVILQIAQNDKFDAHIYDLANAPDEIWELIRLSKAQIRSNVLWFEPETNWMASKSHDDGGLAITSDGRQIISSGLNGPLKIWEADSQKLIRTVEMPQNLPFDGLILSPDNSFGIVEGWGTIGVLDAKTWQKIRIIEEPFIDRKRFQLSKPHFIKNGRFLLLESSQPALHIYDTGNWERLKNLPEIPADALSYYPASAKNRAVYLSGDGQTFLRDTRKQRNIAAIDKAKLAYTAFSPDESKVVVVTTGHEGDKVIKYKIRMWNADNGEFIRELRPFEQDVCESVEGLMWSPDGKYLLAATKASIFFSSRSISVWNVKSGRHRAELSGCASEINGLGFLSDKNKIIAGCGDSVIRIWNLAHSLNEISKFEKLITNKN